MATDMSTQANASIIQTIIDRAAELLHAHVWALERREIVIASSNHRAIGMPLALVSECADACLRVPLRVEGSELSALAVDIAEDDTSLHLVQALIELIVTQVTVINQIPNQQQLERQFVYNLLFEPVSDEDTIFRRGNSIGIDLTIPRAVLLIDASTFILGTDRSNERIGDGALAHKRAEAVIAHIVDFFHLRRATICTYIGSGEIVVLKASSTKDLSAWADSEENGSPCASWANLLALKRASSALLDQIYRAVRSPVTMGIGRYYPGIEGLSRSYQDARAALSLGRRSLGPNRVHCLDAIGIAAFVGVADTRTKLELATHLLSPLDHEDELLRTLQVFFARDCSITETANFLNVHRNTLNYRLDKVTSLTGLNPHRFDDAVQIRLALLLRRLESEPAGYAPAQIHTLPQRDAWPNAR
jgi:carbohydrate diacid regulator